MNTTTFFHGFDIAGWQVCYERCNGGRMPRPFFEILGPWRDFTVCIGRWRVMIGHDRMTRSGRKSLKALRAYLGAVD